MYCVYIVHKTDLLWLIISQNHQLLNTIYAVSSPCPLPFAFRGYNNGQKGLSVHLKFEEMFGGSQKLCEISCFHVG